MLNLIDEYTHACLCIYVARRINAAKVKQVMAALIDLHGAPEHIRSDNGSEFIEIKLRTWLAENKIKTLCIEPGSPWQNGYIESFDPRQREECLNREKLWTLTGSRDVGGLALDLFYLILRANLSYSMSADFLDPTCSKERRRFRRNPKSPIAVGIPAYIITE